MPSESFSNTFFPRGKELTSFCPVQNNNVSSCVDFETRCLLHNDSVQNPPFEFKNTQVTDKTRLHWRGVSKILHVT